jgi:hypothetical protein
MPWILFSSTKLAPQHLVAPPALFFRVVGDLGFHHIAVERALLVEQGRRGRAQAVRAVVAAWPVSQPMIRSALFSVLTDIGTPSSLDVQQIADQRRDQRFRRRSHAKRRLWGPEPHGRACCRVASCFIFASWGASSCWYFRWYRPPSTMKISSNSNGYGIRRLPARAPRFALAGYAWRSHARPARAKHVRRSESEDGLAQVKTGCRKLSDSTVKQPGLSGSLDRRHRA